MPVSQKSSLKNKIIEYIYDAILNDEYKNNDQIKEAPLALKFEVSRAPIREALLELVSLGVLEQIERRGVFVKDITKKYEVLIKDSQPFGGHSYSIKFSLGSHYYFDVVPSIFDKHQVIFQGSDHEKIKI